MRLLTISIGNLRRRKGRAALLMAGLTLGVALVVALMGITTAMKSDMERKLDEYGANIIVTPLSESVALSYGGVSVADASYQTAELSASDVKKINSIDLSKNISAVAPKLIGAHTIKTGDPALPERSVMIVGVDFPSELRIKRWWRLMPDDAAAHDMHGGGEGPGILEIKKGEILIGSAAASILNVKTGSMLMLNNGHFHVKGVLSENASQDDVGVFMWMEDAENVLGRHGRVSMIEVSALCSQCPIEDIVAQISAAVPHAKVSAVRQAMQLKMQTVDQMVRFSAISGAVVTAVAGLIVFFSMMSNVNERTREIGVLRAIGYRKSHIAIIILAEASMVSIAAGAIGASMGYAITGVLLPGAQVNNGLMLMLMAISAGSAVVIAVISSIYPAMRASSLEPNLALRQI